MKLKPNTVLTLQTAYSIYQPKGFHTEKDIIDFWHKRHGAIGFLNIKEITPSMVREIREVIIEKN